MVSSHSIRIFANFTRRGSSSSLQTYLEEEDALVFTFFLSFFAIRHVCLEKLGKSDLLIYDLPLMTLVAKSPLSDLELSSLEFQS
jgi:hypothetical protein